MKLNYESPAIEIVEIAIEDCILQGSGTDKPNGSILEDLYEGIFLY